MTNSEARSFADIVALAYQQLGPNSPTETVAQQYVQIIAGASGQEAGDPFDLRYLDELLSQAVDGGVLAGAITAFQLTPMS
jgi:hypothetical protein